MNSALACKRDGHSQKAAVLKKVYPQSPKRGFNRMSEKNDLKGEYAKCAEEVCAMLPKFYPAKSGSIFVKVEAGRPKHIDQELVTSLHNDSKITHSDPPEMEKIRATVIGQLENLKDEYGSLIIEIVKGIPDNIKCKFVRRLLL